MLKIVFSKIKRFKSQFPFIIDSVIILLPFTYYFFLINNRLFPVEYPDAFSYLWRQKLTTHFFLGRSLTQRIIYTLCLNNPVIISNIQLSLYALSSLILYHLFKRKSRNYNIALMLIIIAIFSSYIFNVSAVIINSEPIFLSLLILFPSILFLWTDKYRARLIILFGILYILSKNVAPYIMLLLLFLHFVFKKTCSKKMTVVYIALILLSFIRLLTTHLYDTSIHINVANNIFVRVFESSKATQFFHEKYGMPIGPFVKECRGSNVNKYCIDDSPVFIINLDTRNLELIDDKYGLVKWIKLKGQQSYMRYILFDSGKDTYDNYNKAFKFFYKKETILFTYNYMDYNPEKKQISNKLLLNKTEEFRGFFGFEPLAVLSYLLGLLGFNYTIMVHSYIITGIFIVYLSPYKSYMALAVTLLLSALALFFLSFFGDGMEFTRHVFPAYVLLSFGGLLFVFSALEITVQLYSTQSAKRN